METVTTIMTIRTHLICILFSVGSLVSVADEKAGSWTQFTGIDEAYPHHFARADGSHLFLFNKTAWHFFTQKNPQITLDRAHAIGANVIRVGLECAYYFEDIKLDAWPWGGTRASPDFTTFNEAYWEQVDQRLELAAAQGIGVNLTLFSTLKLPDKPASFDKIQPYLQRVIARLAKHPNIFCWEVHNEHVSNPGFQAQVGGFMKQHDPHHRPVISSNGTTDYPLWPNAPWMDMALIHHCTGSTPSFDLRDWYLAIARNLRVYGKPAFNNETGREVRHKNDDPVSRRKQLWLAAAAGGYTTWHSWDGCEGIDDATYVAPGQEFVAPYVRWWSAQQFWRVDPDFTAVQLAPTDALRDELVPVALVSASRELALVYLFTRKTGTSIDTGSVQLRLPEGDYRVEFFHPADGTLLGDPVTHVAPGLRKAAPLKLPAFTDDLALRIIRTVTRDQTAIPGTQ
jgi:hypothetical protein